MLFLQNPWKSLVLKPPSSHLFGFFWNSPLKFSPLTLGAWQIALGKMAQHYMKITKSTFLILGQWEERGVKSIFGYCSRVWGILPAYRKCWSMNFFWPPLSGRCSWPITWGWGKCTPGHTHITPKITHHISYLSPILSHWFNQQINQAPPSPYNSELDYLPPSLCHDDHV